MYVDTLHLKDERSLVSVANEIFPIFQITKFDKHSSTFYPTGQFYLGRCPAFDLRVMVEDEIGYEEYNFCLVFGHHDRASDGRREVLRTLLKLSYQLCSPRGDERNPTRDVFSLGPDDQIVAKNEPVKTK